MADRRAEQPGELPGLHGSEERVNEMLGNLAPLMSFVGGSAGDDLRFAKTEVY